ncbi:phe operon leader peptide [Yersinia pseudotuberculosis IP 31758]|uniref:Leader peptide of chorismate mutase-P-prephenate dehydratase n=2 Tax=Yersinia pseudotuberculosis complex TaxID=1649845 RepID=Q8D183_YERPE|nr:leader peptide of chorismate mutase-P-prephenate dehydratase [Yersinia pestis KIM10+]ABS49346.1 phe operon leader peptide [Yersinia pseudotuberculosis IP 31758]
MILNKVFFFAFFFTFP